MQGSAACRLVRFLISAAKLLRTTQTQHHYAASLKSPLSICTAIYPNSNSAGTIGNRGTYSGCGRGAERAPRRLAHSAWGGQIH
jgi:hypothetical protein